MKFDLTMIRKLANGDEPYGNGPFDSRHIELDQRDAQQLVAELDRLRALENTVAAVLDPTSPERAV